jgi:hypothetical protein
MAFRAFKFTAWVDENSFTLSINSPACWPAKKFMRISTNCASCCSLNPPRFWKSVSICWSGASWVNLNWTIGGHCAVVLVFFCCQFGSNMQANYFPGRFPCRPIIFQADSPPSVVECCASSSVSQTCKEDNHQCNHHRQGLGHSQANPILKLLVQAIHYSTQIILTQNLVLVYHRKYSFLCKMKIC